jgi:hypothetical protein
MPCWYRLPSNFGFFSKRVLIFLFLETGENVDQLCIYQLGIKDFAAWK